jgi:hypothetical protein
VTVVPAASSALQLDPPAEVHEMPPPATTPLPVTETVSANVVAAFVNAAFTVVSESSWTVQLVSVPEHGPPQPLKVYPLSGSSTSVIVEPVKTSHVQLASPVSQLIEPPLTFPPSLLESLVLLTVSVWLPGFEADVKFAVTSFALPFSVTTQISFSVPFVSSHPDQLEKVHSPWSVAVISTSVPVTNVP